MRVLEGRVEEGAFFECQVSASWMNSRSLLETLHAEPRLSTTTSDTVTAHFDIKIGDEVRAAPGPRFKWWSGGKCDGRPHIPPVPR